MSIWVKKMLLLLFFLFASVINSEDLSIPTALMLSSKEKRKSPLAQPISKRDFCVSIRCLIISNESFLNGFIYFEISC